MRALLCLLSLVYVTFSFDVIPARINLTKINSPTSGLALDSGWTLSMIQDNFEHPYFQTCYWGIIKHNIGNKVAYSVAYYGSNRGTHHDTVITTYDSLYQEQNYYWSFDELKAAPAGKVQVSIIKADSVYLIISDTIKTTIYTHHQHNQGDYWDRHTTINQSYPSLEFATVQNKQIVFNYPNSNGWTISNGNLLKAGITYSSPKIYAVGKPFVDYKNNVWFYGKTATDTVLAKLEAWNGFDLAYTYDNDSVNGYVKHLMNVSSDIVKGYVGKKGIYATTLFHPPRYIGPDTLRNTSGCNELIVYSDKIKFHRDTNHIANYLFYPNQVSSVSDSTLKLTQSYKLCLSKGSCANIHLAQALIVVNFLGQNFQTDYHSNYDHIDTIYYQYIHTSQYLNIDSIPPRVMTVGDYFIDTVIAYGAHTLTTSTYDSYDSLLQITNPGTHPSLDYADGRNIYLTSSLPSWLTATKINKHMIVIAGTIPNVSSVNLTISIVDSMPYIKSLPLLTTYRTDSKPLVITVNQPVNHKPIAANDTTITINQGEVYVYTLQATDADDDNLTYSYSTTIPVTQNVNEFIFQPTASGSYLITLYVSDNKSTDSCLITLIVQASTSTISKTVTVVKKAITYTAYNLRGQNVGTVINYKTLRPGKYVLISKQKQFPISIVK